MPKILSGWTYVVFMLALPTEFTNSKSWRWRFLFPRHQPRHIYCLLCFSVLAESAEFTLVLCFSIFCKYFSFSAFPLCLSTKGIKKLVSWKRVEKAQLFAKRACTRHNLSNDPSSDKSKRRSRHRSSFREKLC